MLVNQRYGCIFGKAQRSRLTNPVAVLESGQKVEKLLLSIEEKLFRICH